MKKLVLLLSIAALGLTGSVSADIQAPPGSFHTPTRKLSRALANIIYGIVEVPEQVIRKTDMYGGKSGYSYGALDGGKRALQRLGYGFYELVTFYAPTHKGTYKAPYTRCGKNNTMEFNVHDGLSEFPPTLGFESSQYSRVTDY